ncbi:MAG: DUF6713 family protein [bacterium]
MVAILFWSEILFWLYFINCAVLIMHQIDASYWKEWEMINLPGGIIGNFIFNILVVPAFLYGLILVWEGSIIGNIFSLLLSLTGLFVFFFHFYFLKRGDKKFDMFISKLILAATLIVSIIELAVTLFQWL